MSSRLRSTRRGAALALALFASLLSCGRDLTGPGGRGSLAALQFAPDFSAMVDSVDGIAYSVADLVPFNRVRIELRRLDNTVAAAQVVDFPSSATEIPLEISVRLGAAAQNGAEPLTAFLRYINAAGDTVFAGGPIAVTAESGRGQTEPVSIPIVPTVPGAVFASVSLSPDSAEGNAGATLSFTATGFDGQGGVVSNAIIGFISRNPALVLVPNLGQGNVTLVGTRGSTWLVAQSLTGLRDSAFIKILPVPSQIVKASGDAQTALQAATFAQPLRVRVLASDNLPVAGATVSFAVTSGGGSVSAPTAQTDSAGFASVMWTAGSILGAASVTASVGSPAITTTFTGSQVNAGPTSLAFETEPVNITAGDTLPPIRVAVRNALGQAITSFTGAVSLTRVGTGGGLLVGDTAVAAVAGVATFRGLTLTRAGTDYRLVASLSGVPNQLSSTFAVTAAPPHAIQLVSGGSQVSDPSTVLPAPIVVRVVDIFAQPVVGTTVNFAVQSGGGSATPTSAITDANGQASTQWTLGPLGPQLLRATAGQAPALNISAQLSDLGGPPTLFAGYDSTLVRIGFERTLPLYISSTADTAITATLSTNTPGLVWASPTANFAPFSRRTDVVLSAADTLQPGTYWAYLTSAIGTDSIEVAVDSALVMFTGAYYTEVLTGDTVHVVVRSSEPAPAGGLVLRVRSVDATAAQVLAGTGAGPTTPGCLNPEYCFVSNAQTTVGAPADSVDLVIPEGELAAHVAIIVTTPPGASFTPVPLEVSAPKHRTGGITFNALGATPFLSGPSGDLGVGLSGLVRVSIGQANPAQARVFRLRSLTPAIFAVDSAVVLPRLEYYSPNVELRALAEGTGQLEFGNAQVGYDTVSVTVVQPRLAILSPVHAATTASTRTTYVYLQTPSNATSMTPLANVPITLTSLDSTVAVPEARVVTVLGGETEAMITVRFVAPGATQIVATAPGFLADTMYVTVSPTALTVTMDAGTAAVGTLTNWSVGITSRSGDVGAPRSIRLQPRNPSRARVVVPEFDVTRVGFGTATFQVVGLSTGVDTADVYLDGDLVASQPYVVSTPRLLLSSSFARTIDPDSTFLWTLPALLTDSLNYLRMAADTIRGTLRSSNPSVVLVRDSLVVIEPSQSGVASEASILGVQPGTAVITLSAPGFADFVDTITVRPPVLTLSGPNGVGLGLVNYVSLVRNSLPASGLPLTITHQGPGRVEFVNPVTEFPAGEDLLFEYLQGVTVGVDTVIVSAPGHVPDTAVYTVYGSRAALLVDRSVQTGYTDEFVSASLRFFESSMSFDPATTRRFVVRSLDTTKAVVLQDTIVVPAIFGSGERRAQVRYLGAGVVSLVMTDVDGALAADTVDVTVTRARLSGWTEWDQRYMPIGVRQRSYPENMYVELGYEVSRNTWVRFTTSRPGLITVPDSVMIPAGESYAYFDIAAGDTVGTVRVTASIPGVTPWEFDVAVTRSIINVCGCGAYVGSDSDVEVYVVDGLEEYSRPLAVATTMRLSSENAGIASIVQPTFTFPADSDNVSVRALRGVSVGRTIIRAADTSSTAFDAFEAGFGEVSVREPSLTARNTRFFTAPSLETTASDHFVDASVIRDSVWVRLTSTTGRMQPVTDSVLVAKRSAIFDSRIMSYTDASLTPFRLRGVSVGEDTVVFSADGLPTHRVPVTVQPGVMRLAAGTPSVVTVGDSVRVRVNFAGPDGTIEARSTAPITLNFGFMTPGLRLAPSVVNAVDQSVIVPAGQTFVEFWVRADAAGFGTFEINSPSFRTLRITFEARTRP